MRTEYRDDPGDDAGWQKCVAAYDDDPRARCRACAKMHTCKDNPDTCDEFTWAPGREPQ